jgi:multidrug efflux pump subunit AcrA (membrane-fusion protein)
MKDKIIFMILFSYFIYYLMTKKFSILIVVCILILSWCGRPTTESTIITEKQPFFITIAPQESLKKAYALKKTWKLASSSEITVTAQIWGRVVSLNKGIWDKVQKGESVIQLQENSGVYNFGAQKASVAITQAQINYEQTMLSLEKAIQDTKFGIEQAMNQANNASLNKEVSAANLQLQSSRENYEKAKFDYETKLIADEQTILNFSQTAKNLLVDVQLTYDSVIVEADKILWVTTLRQTNNDAFENLLGARNTTTKFTAQDELRKVILEQQRLNMFLLENDTTYLVWSLDELVTYMRWLQPMLTAIDTMLQYSITWPTYSESQLAIHQNTIDWLQSQVQGQISALTAQINTMQTFLRTYKEGQASLAKAVNLTEQSYKTAQANLQTTENNAIVQVSSLQNTLENTLKNKETTQRALENSIRQAQISYNEANFQLEKLRASAPIAGSITDILVDVGQDIAPWTPLYTMSSIWEKEIEITLTQEEATTLTSNTPLKILFWTKTIDGVLSQISQTPTAGVSYKAIVTTQSNEIPAGSLVDVIIEQATDYLVIPLNRVQLLSTKEGQITLRNGTALETKRVELGKLKWSQIEIITPIIEDIVISDIKQYDPEKHTIEIKKNENIDR